MCSNKARKSSTTNEKAKKGKKKIAGIKRTKSGTKNVQ
jgi:hypothetical protein